MLTVYACPLCRHNLTLKKTPHVKYHCPNTDCDVYRITIEWLDDM